MYHSIISSKCSQLKAKPNVYITLSACHSTNRCGSSTASSGSSSKATTGAGPEYHKDGSNTTVWQVEPSSPREVPYFDSVSADDWDHLITSLEKGTDQEDLWKEAEPWSKNASETPEGVVMLEASENIVEEPPSNLSTEDFIQKIDLGTPDNPCPVFISKNIKDDELPEYVSFLREFVDCFAWSYAEMPGLDPKIAVHKVNLQESTKPVKQGQRRFRPDVMDKIEQEVQKLKSVGFIREEQHLEWLVNIVPVTKKNGQIRVCIDYRDLNGACPKDEFPLPIPEVMIDNTCGFE
ncbi:hypothetical protein MRB53_016535 [Persea americana]|uniref:Uncharacterized protein n=1 Tax=Persea americana TaxID=3435 RepID=A0ACC2M2K2_PERAE|nr:hypothetical protein MRB53_016535 [Persea americana]